VNPPPDDGPPPEDRPTNNEPPEDEEAIGGTEVARTDLAWSRSGLALAVAAAAILKVVVHVTDYRDSVIVFTVLAAAAVAWAFSVAHGRIITVDALEGRLVRDQRKLRTVAIVTVLFAIGSLVVAILPSQ
jgi:uncharacterized membrane protein YidH (DUF202 family)